MARAGRAILAILAGVAVWAVLWNVTTRNAQSMFPEHLQPDQPIDHTGLLLFYILASSLLSVLAGFATAALAGPNPMPAVLGLAILQLVLGIAAEVSYWRFMPAWYHIVFLALVVPATVAGGRLRAGSPRRLAG